jgi:glycosyltransferase involved in cell wall biosynthesis
VIAVDDRSTDRTGEIMDAIAASDRRLRVVHNRELPDGWLGKSHALWLGAQAAEGKFLLFTDGDILFSPQAIAAGAAYANEHGVEHLCLVPRMLAEGYCEEALVAFFSLIFVIGTQPRLVPTPFRRAYCGIGAFNLVRADAYRDVGGHEAIRLDILDDVKLGKLFKNTGKRSDILLAVDDVAVRWQSSFVGSIRGLEKNAFASQEFSVLRMLWVTCVFVLLLFVPFAGAAAFGDARRYGYLAAVVISLLLYGANGRMIGARWRILPALPLAGAVMLYTFWRSAIVTLRQGGVRWRETFYPLKLLRKNVYK